MPISARSIRRVASLVIGARLTIVAKLCPDAVILGHTVDTPNPASCAVGYWVAEKTPTPFQLYAYALSQSIYTQLKVEAHLGLAQLASPRYSWPPSHKAYANAKPHLVCSVAGGDQGIEEWQTRLSELIGEKCKTRDSTIDGKREPTNNCRNCTALGD